MSTMRSTPRRSPANASFGGGGAGGIVEFGGSLVTVVVAPDVDSGADVGELVVVEAVAVGATVVADAAVTATVLTGAGVGTVGSASGPSPLQPAAMVASTTGGPSTRSGRIPRVWCIDRTAGVRIAYTSWSAGAQVLDTDNTSIVPAPKNSSERVNPPTDASFTVSE